MRVMYMIPPGNIPCMEDIHHAVLMFYEKYKIRPSTIKLNGFDMTNFLKSFHSPILVLEAGKRYDNFVQTSCGPVRLALLEDEQTILMSSYNHTNQPSTSAIIVDNSDIDTEFEKHVLDQK